MDEQDTVDATGYTIGGKRYARVSAIVKFSGLDDFSSIPDGKREYYLKRGTEAHRLFQMVEEGTADDFDFDPEIEKYRAGHAKFLKDTGFRALPGGIEMRVKNDDLGYAGQVDRIGTMQGRVVLLDYKSGTITKGGGLQTALYLRAIPDYKFDEVDRYIVAIKQNGTYAMSEKYPLSDESDAVFWATKYREKLQETK